jgi:hypothetical protein
LSTSQPSPPPSLFPHTARYINTTELAKNLTELTSAKKTKCVRLLRNMVNGQDEFAHYTAYVDLMMGGAGKGRT